jgi:phenylacetate-CoA ligase
MHLTARGAALLELCDPASGEAIQIEDGATGEFVWTHVGREASPLLRYRSADLGTVWTRSCACGRAGLRLRIEGRTDDMIRVRAANVYPQAVGAVLGERPGLGRYAIVAEGDPVEPPLRVLVEAAEVPGAELERLERELRRRLGAAVTLQPLSPGALPVAEHKTRLVYRPARGDELPAAVACAPE